ncbi:hypothetical protein CU097_007865, partial [Rhizopus azygosporus]
DAVTFFWRYALQRRVICASLASVSIRPTLADGVPTAYNTVGIENLAGSTFCVCLQEKQQHSWLNHLKRVCEGMGAEIAGLEARLDRLIDDK